MADRQTLYKNVGKDSETLRKNRIEQTVAIRKEKREDIMSKRRNIPQYFFFHITIYMSRKFEESPRTLGSRFLNDKYLIYRIHDLSINLINYKIGMMMHRRAGMAVLHRSKYLTTKLICKKLFFRHKAQILK